jgi:cytochrome c-type biogenesis protein CcmH
MKRWLVIVFALLLSLGAIAKDAAPLAEDPVLEARLMAISEELRCLVCQNESLAGSRADLALDLRREIRTMIRDGKTDKEILDFMVGRYGDFVRYRPPVKPTTWLLWVGPFLLLGGGVAAMLMFLRRRTKQPLAGPLSDEERHRAEALLANSSSKENRS